MKFRRAGSRAQPKKSPLPGNGVVGRWTIPEERRWDFATSTETTLIGQVLLILRP